MKKLQGRKRDFSGLERRRMRAARLFARRFKQADVMRLVGGTRQSVSVWHKAWEKGGKRALRAAGRAGRKPCLTAVQWRQIESALLEGPQEHGYQTQLWTLPRIALLIKRLTGIAYHPGHVWHLLHRMKWTCQRPATKAKERNEAAIRRWRKYAWPRIKKSPPPERHFGISRREWLFSAPQCPAHLGTARLHPIVAGKLQLETTVGHWRHRHLAGNSAEKIILIAGSGYCQPLYGNSLYSPTALPYSGLGYPNVGSFARPS